MASDVTRIRHFRHERAPLDAFSKLRIPTSAANSRIDYETDPDVYGDRFVIREPTVRAYHRMNTANEFLSRACQVFIERWLMALCCCKTPRSADELRPCSPTAKTKLASVHANHNGVRNVVPITWSMVRL